MTVKDLKHIIERQTREMPNYENWQVVIRTSEPSVGACSCVPAKSVGFGFDWDSGRFFIYPVVGLIEKDKNAKRD